ncbi:hypothetical protein DEA8626_02029 [Defluviimonas aquaemixtae]|uniref:DUF2244 domain-containing protein n=1 Tax=Albidovulum aquaemixtae TaxID=1542388 RepID=A0A2R8B7E4_9RHOB|nr:DUF2244 domain-containing protein [Defluviimonas aquaemixtae]SPH18490.1 hypothetical protein DEA8626_02029 [Defluviimonas aquaemixtae]
MPYEWVRRPNGAPEQSGALSLEPRAELHLWPFRSLPRRGFVLFIAVTAAMLAIPLVAVLGTVVLWGLLPFMVAAVMGVWWALSRSYREGELVEILTVASDRIEIVRRAPDGAEKRWSANLYWVSVQLYPSGGRVPNYLTIKGEGREIELGAFLSEEERQTLAEELRQVLIALR